MESCTSPISSRKSVPPSASSNRPFFRCVGAGERPFLVAEELRFDQRIRQRAAAHLDERLLRPRGVVVNRARDELLAGAGFPAQQHRGARPRHLGHLLVDALHRAAVADDAGKVVALAELLLQVRVLVDQPLVLGRHQALHLERLADHRRRHAEERLRAVVVAIRLELQVDAERADHAPIEPDRHADEAGLVPGALVARRRAEDERRLLADARHDHRLAGLDDLPDDPLADRVLDVVGGPVQAVGRLDVELPAVVVHEHDEAARDGVPARERLEDLVNRRLRVQGAREGLANLQQRAPGVRARSTDCPARWFGSRAWSSCVCGRHYDKNVIMRITCDSNSDSAARCRQAGKTRQQ